QLPTGAKPMLNIILFSLALVGHSPDGMHVVTGTPTVSIFCAPAREMVTKLSNVHDAVASSAAAAEAFFKASDGKITPESTAGAVHAAEALRDQVCTPTEMNYLDGVNDLMLMQPGIDNLVFVGVAAPTDWTVVADKPFSVETRGFGVSVEARSL